MGESTDNYYSDNDLDSIYNEKYFVPRYEQGLQKWAVKAKFIKKLLNPKRILDIGCAEGYLVTELNKLGIDAFGIDGSKYALSQAPDLVKKKVFRVNFNCDVFPFPDNHFDSVCCLHAVEHIHKIDFFASELFRVMKDHSKAWIVTPNGSERNRNTMDVNINTFKTWKRLFERNGFQVKKQRQYGFLELKGRSSPLKLYKLPEPILTCLKYIIFWFLNESLSFRTTTNEKGESVKKTKELSFLLIKN